MNQDFLNYLVSVSSTEIGKEVDASVNGIRKFTCIFGNKICFNFGQSPFVQVNSISIKYEFLKLNIKVSRNKSERNR